MNKQKIALVTGGTGGIGTAICIALADQGRKVIAGYFPPEKEIADAWQQKHRANGYEIDIVACDVSDFESSQQMLHDVENTIGAVDILVNCAGITRDKTLRRMTSDQWDSVLRTNLDSAFNVTRHVVDNMADNGFGRIVNISQLFCGKGWTAWLHQGGCTGTGYQGCHG
jgi:acetoacetyl-CoA reductase